MERRTCESPMDWEYQNSAPMDPSSPFAQSSRLAQDRNIFGGSSSFSAFSQNQNGFARAPMTPSKPLPPTPMQQQQHLQSPSIFQSSRIQRTSGTPFRNPAFTTPHKPFDADALSEVSAAESSPAATDGSDFPETPDHDQSFSLAQMTITPATMSKQNSRFPKKASGKGEISKTVFPTRDKVRKRKRYNADKDVSGYRLPYRYSGEGDESDYESDESTFEPSQAQGSQKKRSRDGWFGSFLSTLQRHPHAPSILGYWLNFGFSLICVTGTVWIGWTIITGLRQDFAGARSLVRSEILDEMAKCRSDYIDNHCAEGRAPALTALCEQWEICMNKNPDNLKTIQLGAKGIVEIINEIVDTMSYKTITLLVLCFAIFLFSGRSLYKTAHDYPDLARHSPTAYGEPQPSAHAAPPQVYWQAIQPQTPRHNMRRLVHNNDETPETDASPPRFRALPPPETPRGRRSPSKGERARSPTKSRSPTKRF
ncbi:hypothetical protein F4777DRAFT_540611 [Nemania sp. FL0916]|nr:hypothetical protein F4777DRAFT_540611 [Nemania sp. FL0916]